MNKFEALAEAKAWRRLGVPAVAAPVVPGRRYGAWKVVKVAAMPRGLG